MIPELPSDSHSESILDAASDVIARHGYIKANEARIIGSAGVSDKTFFELFSDKEAVIFAVLKRYFSHTHLRMQDAFARTEKWPDRVYTGLRALLEIIAKDPDSAKVNFVEIQLAGPEGVRQLHDCMKECASFLFPTKGELPSAAAIPQGIGDQILGAVIFSIYTKVAAEETTQLVDLLPELTEIALTPYLGPEAAYEFVRSRNLIGTRSAQPRSSKRQVGARHSS